MKMTICKLCGEIFDPHHLRDHTCEYCEAEMGEHDEREVKKREDKGAAIETHMATKYQNPM